VINPRGDALALIHHEKLDRWLQPGGHIEPTDRSHEDAARREVAEECGVADMSTVGILDVDVHVFPARGEQPTHRHYDVRWAFVASTDELVAGDGTMGSRWVSLGEALGMHRSIARPAQKIVDLVKSGWMPTLGDSQWAG
jgi:8-oxo-dGTP pyrophosphatase MutT (NUDIX family)